MIFSLFALAAPNGFAVGAVFGALLVNSQSGLGFFGLHQLLVLCLGFCQSSLFPPFQETG